jgi:hypothetical protein
MFRPENLYYVYMEFWEYVQFFKKKLFGPVGDEIYSILWGDAFSFLFILRQLIFV